MIKSSTGEVCSPNDDIKALDLHGTNALRARLLQIQADSGSGEEALLAEAEIRVGVEQAAKQAEIDKTKQALSDFRSYLAQSPTGPAAQALPSDSELVYTINPDTQQCEITRLDGAPIVLSIAYSGLSGELLLPPQLMVTELDCSNNELTTLPKVLPPSMTWINCGYNRLTTLPEVLPASLTVLNCYFNQLIALPKLPVSLTELWCNDNQLTTLPELPPSMTELNCENNRNLANNPAVQAALQELRDRGATGRS